MSDPQFINPLDTFQNSFKLGAGIRQIQDQRRIAEAAAAAEADRQTAAAAAAADKQARLSNFNEKLRSGTATIQDYMMISGDMTKDQNDAMQEGFKQLDADQRESALKETGELFAALKSGQTDLALSMMDDHIKALENSNSPAEAKAMKMLRDFAAIDPVGAAGYFGTTLGRMGTEGQTILDNALKLQTENGQNLTGADISLKQAQAREINTKTDSLLAESEATKKRPGGLTAKEVIDKEADIRKEFYTRQAAYREAQRNLLNIRDSSKDVSGAGDVALVTSFMKMLDPGSVVRETEFANARDTSGLLGQLQSAATKIQNGTFLTPTQRAAFARLAEQYMAPIIKRQESDRKTFDRIVKNYGLNPENVFNVEEPEPPKEVAEGQAGKEYLDNLKKFLKEHNPNSAKEIDAMKSEDLVIHFPNGVKTYQDKNGEAPPKQEVREVDL